MFPPGLGTGESLHAIWRSEFRHRWGGNVPSWTSLTEGERRLWLHVEHRALLDLLMPYVLTRFTSAAGGEDDGAAGDAENDGDWRGKLAAQQEQHAPDCHCNRCIGALGSPFPSEPVKMIDREA